MKYNSTWAFLLLKIPIQLVSYKTIKNKSSSNLLKNNTICGFLKKVARSFSL